MKAIEHAERLAQHQTDTFQAGFYLAVLGLYNDLYATLEPFSPLAGGMTIDDIELIALNQSEAFGDGVVAAEEAYHTDLDRLSTEKQMFKYVLILGDIVMTPYAHSKVHDTLASLSHTE